jgi:hypothetical protein
MSAGGFETRPYTGNRLKSVKKTGVRLPLHTPEVREESDPAPSGLRGADYSGHWGPTRPEFLSYTRWYPRRCRI